MHRQAQRACGVAIGVANRPDDAGRIALEGCIAFVDPVPCEVADRDRRNAGARGRGVRERRDVAEHHRRAFRRKERRFAVGAAIEAAVELRGASRRVGHVHRQAVGLRHADVRLERFVHQARQLREIKQPPRRHRLHEDASVRLYVDERADEFDAAGRVAKTMAGNVEDDQRVTTSDAARPPGRPPADPRSAGRMAGACSNSL